MLMGQGQIKESLEAVAPGLAPTETTLNLRKSCIWSPGPCHTGNSGIQRSQSVQLVLQQPLLQLQTYAAGVDKIAAGHCCSIACNI